MQMGSYVHCVKATARYHYLQRQRQQLDLIVKKIATAAMSAAPHHGCARGARDHKDGSGGHVRGDDPLVGYAHRMKMSTKVRLMTCHHRAHHSCLRS